MTSSIHKTALWWLAKKVPAAPASYRFQHICHQSHTSTTAAASLSSKSERREFERLMLEGKDCPQLAPTAEAAARTIRAQWAIELIEQKRSNPTLRTNCAKALCKIAFPGSLPPPAPKAESL